MVAALAEFFGVSVDYLIGQPDKRGEVMPLTPEQKKWLDTFAALSKKDAEKVLSYAAFLLDARQREDRRDSHDKRLK